MSENKSPYCYFFRLQPLGKFFFGNERTFGEGVEANYLVRSNAFPQQTSLLGMLRFEILKSYNELFPITSQNKEAVGEKIGKASFDHEHEKSFGVIERLSPVLIADSNHNIYHKAPINHSYDQYLETKDKAHRWSRGSRCEATQLVFPEFHPKEDYPTKFRGSQGCLMDEERIFIEDNQIGIQISRDKTDNKGFYKQYNYRMKPGFAFCFWAEFSEKLQWQTKYVTLGADHSTFRLEIQEQNWDTDFERKHTSLTINDNPIVLLSDAFVSDDFYDYCRFSIADTIDFRYVRSTVKEGRNYSGRPFKSTAKLNLLQRGSVIYPKKGADLKSELDNPIFRNIGYNYYKIP